MNKLYLNNGEASRLIVIFLGWGFPPEIFSGLRKPGYDILLISGYDEWFSPSEVDEFIISARASLQYEEIVVIGWSFGVKAAERFLVRSALPITLRLAVNGTEYHINDDKGIPEAVFRGTLDGLTERSLQKFLLRSVGSKGLFDELFKEVGIGFIETQFQQLQKQLAWFGTIPATPICTDKHLWDKVIIGEEDRIFPLKNQQQAWSGYDCFIIPKMPHVADFQWVLDDFVVDKQKVCNKFGSASETYTENAIVQQATAKKLFQYFQIAFEESDLKHSSQYTSQQLSILELGYGDGMFTKQYIPMLKDACSRLMLCDIQVGDLPEVLIYSNPDMVIRRVAADVETQSFVAKYLSDEDADLIFSSSMFQWLNSPATMLRRCYSALKQGGMMALSFYGPGTLSEISSTIGNGLKYPSAEWMKTVALEAGFSVNLLESTVENLTFDSATAAMKHLKLTGVNGLSEVASPAKTRFLLKNWPTDEKGRATLTFCPIYMVLTKN